MRICTLSNYLLILHYAISLSKKEILQNAMIDSKIDMDSETVSTAVPLGVDGAVGVSDTKWFVAIVNSRHEKSIAEKLLEINIVSYVATQKEMRLWKNGRRKLIDRVVIPSMVFVKCTEEQRRSIVALPYINRFMVNRTVDTKGLNKPVAVISDPEIQKLKFMLGQTDYQIEFVPTVFRTHDNVRVIRGSLRGLEGEIQNNPDGTHCLVVSIPILGGAIMHIDPKEVEKISSKN